jgi:hypothetical protein
LPPEKLNELQLRARRDATAVSGVPASSTRFSRAGKPAFRKYLYVTTRPQVSA